ncbi:hypothetical protein [Pararhizobium sp.]|uniref:hypothetical protein n=1 Tax=Pararhizobium sp. TaxID=1977563 RepID=UPI002724CBE5|nr:hypothetical protein [Pararhizobium sp.]MDO9416102.1 hypothetical protein [Pararhizobium sp.]
MPPMKPVTKKPPENDPYDPARFSERHGIRLEDAKRILILHRGDRDSCDRAAHNLNGLN